MSSRSILITTDPAGDFAQEEPAFCGVLAIALTKGDLDDAVTVDVRDVDTDTSVHFFEEVATDLFWRPSPFEVPVIYGTLRVVVANGGDTKHGHIRLLTWG